MIKNKNMDYINQQDKNIRNIFSKYQKWYQAGSDNWGDRYMREKRDILTKKRNEKEARIILKNLSKNCKKILDAPCGYGRISNILASRGYDVTGIDIDKYFIDIAIRQSAKKNLKVVYLIGDILKKKLYGKFDAVLNIFTSIGYLESDKKNELFIKRLCDYVAPSGRLVIEVVNPIALLANYRTEDTAIMRDGATLYYKRFFDIKTSTTISRTREVERNGRSKSIAHIIRVYYPHELINICEKFDCHLVSILDHNGNKKDIKNSMRIWMVFEKNRIYSCSQNIKINK